MFNYCVSSDVRRNIALHSHLQACCCCKSFYVRDRLSHFELEMNLLRFENFCYDCYDTREMKN